LRKAAHVFIFLLLGCSVTNTIRQTTDSFRRTFVISLIWCSAYAASDEIHQYFIPGRACMWQDWLLDTVSALLGITLVLYIVRRRISLKGNMGSVKNTNGIESEGRD